MSVKSEKDLLQNIMCYESAQSASIADNKEVEYCVQRTQNRKSDGVNYDNHHNGKNGL